MTTKINKPTSLYSLLLIQIFDHTSLNTITPVLTLLFFDLQSSLFSPDTPQETRRYWFGLCLALPHALNLVVTPFLSILSDTFGRKKLLLVSLLGAFVFALTTAFGIFYGSLTVVVVGCLLRGIFSRTNPIAQAVIGDIAPPEKKIIYMGYLQTAISLGALTGPLIGGYLANSFLFNRFNFSLPLFVSAVIAGIGTLLTVYSFQETFSGKKQLSEKIAPSQKLSWQAICIILFDKKVLRISMILLFCQISWSFYYQFMPPILKTVFNVSPQTLGTFSSFIALWLALGAMFGIRLLDQFFSATGILRTALILILLGTTLTLLIFLTHPNSTYRFLIWLAAIPVAVGDVVAFSCLTASYSEVVSREAQGRVMGVCFIVIALVWMLTGFFGSYLLMGLNPLFPLIVAPFGMLASLAFTKEI